MGYMRAFLLLVFILQILSLQAQKKQIHIDKDEAKQAYQYLNAFRQEPQKFMKVLGVRFDASKVSKVQLRWNDELAKAAEFRAYDMANRNYFDHITPEGIGPNYYIHKAGYSLNKDWIKKLSANNFESIAANHSSAVDGIKAFIIGKGSPNYGHRKHVLGLDTWNGSLYDIGIGFVRVPSGARYKTYLSVIIAKHDW